MKEGDEVGIPILKTPIITWRYYRRKVQEHTVQCLDDSAGVYLRADM